MSATRSRAKRLEMRKRECKRRAEGEYNDRQKYYTLVFIGTLVSKNPAIIIVALCFYIYHMIKADLKYREKLGECDKLSPLVLDLDGDGVEADALAYFDHEGDGWSELSRWAKEDSELGESAGDALDEAGILGFWQIEAGVADSVHGGVNA